MKKWMGMLMAAGMVVILNSALLRAHDEMNEKNEWEEHFDQNLPKRMEHWKKELKLSADQATQMEAAIKDRHAKMMALHEETKTKGKAIWDEADAKINGILTPEQQAKYKEDKEKMKDKMKEHREKRREEMKSHMKENSETK